MSEEKTKSDLVIVEGSQFSAETSTDYSPGNENIALAVTATGITYNGTTGNDSFTGGKEDDHLCGGDGNDWLSGGLGDDVLKGDTGNDTLNGGAGADVLEGGAGNDSLYGGEGLDSFIFAAGHGEDVITDSRSSDIGNDVLRFNGANSGSARFSREGNSLIIQAYGADDRVSVTNFFVNGESSGEIFRQYSFVFDDRTLTETDLLSGVTSWGTANNDNESGWYGVDLMYGGLGNDSLRGGSGNDVLNGGAGDDTLSGGAGVDILEGGAGNDRLSGNEGLDTFIFAVGHGQDVVSDAPSTDIGNDALRFMGANSQNALFSRKGNDLIVHAYGTDDNVTVINFFNNPETPGTVFRQFSFVFDDKTLTEPDLLSGVTTWDTEGNDNALGWYGVDLMYGGLGNDSLRGGSGNDVLNGGAGDDTLSGGAGVDILEGGSGNDRLSGNEGLDTFIFAVGHGQDVVSDAPSTDIGNDTLRFTGANSQNALFSRKGNDLIVHAYGTDDNVTVINFFNNPETPGTVFRQFSFVFDDKTLTEPDLLSGVTTWDTEGNDNALGWYGVDLMYGGLGNDSLRGGSGNDVLNGGAGDDTLSGGAGVDILEGGSGNDRLSGNEGLDTFIFAVGHGQDVVSDAPSTDIGNDTLRFMGANSQNALFSRKGNDLIVHAYGTDDNVTVINFFNNPETPGTVFRQFSFVFDDKTLTEPDLLSGVTTWDTEGNDNALGWYGVDLMYGGLGNDSLRGGSGNDVLHGGVGDDTLSGGAGVDILEGGSGNDRLSGNEGLDTFIFAVGHGQDVVSDAPSTDIGNDALRFMGANSQNALFSRKGNDLIVHAYGTDDNVTVINFFNNPETPGTVFRQISFVFDDKTLTEPDLLSGVTTWDTEGNDNALGWYGVDLMYGGLGNDSLRGGSGNDVLNGGAGNDSLYGNSGEDTYQFTAGHGNDYVYDTAGSGENGDILRFTGALSGAARFSRDGTNLIIQAYGSDDSVTVSNYFGGTDQPGEIYRQFSFVFDDATLTESDLARSGMTYNGTDVANNATGWYAPDLMYGAGGNDTLHGGGGNDVLNGGAGNDSLYGNSGEDTYQFTAGHGKDHVYDSAGSGENGDILRFTGALSGAARFSRDGTNLIIQAYGSDDSVTVSNYFGGTDQPGEIYRQFSFVFDDATLTESDLARSGMTYNGTDVANNATGWYAPDLMYGAGGNDTLHGGGGNDVLNGGAGNDSLYGNSGEDTYQFTAGHGKDYVYDTAGSGENGDILRFTGASSGAARFSREGNNLIIQAYGSDDSVTVNNYFAGTDQPGGIYRQFSFVFDDATLTESDLARSGMTYNGTDVANNASGWYASDLMYGAGGNDTLQGGGGNDVLNGGAGNDSLNGNSGEDTYQFTAGHGKDHVYDSAGSGENGDILRFTGAASGAARFSREGTSLVIQAYGSDDSVTVSNYFGGTDQPGGIYRQFSFVFDDATLTESDLAKSGMTYNGTDVGNNITGWYGVDLMNGGGGNDTLSGVSGDDVLNGGAGNDVLNGGAGQDTYLFANGHGNDRVTDYAGKLEGKDIIEFSDLNLTDLWFSKSNSNLLITESGSQDSVEVINWYSNADSQNKIIHTHDGYEIDAAQVQQLVEAMSTFAATHSELSAADQQTGFMHSVSVSSYLEAAK